MKSYIIAIAIIFTLFANHVNAHCNATNSLLVNCNGTNRVRAHTNSGWVCGTIRPADNGIIYASFRGIPYAEYPIGKYRFAELRPKVPWNGYYDAKSEGAICPQYDDVYGHLVNQSRRMSEECTHVNVHVPLRTHKWDTGCKINTKARLPILVFIYGGSFQIGAGDSDLFGPEFIVSKGVITITFNYRLNVFGFLSLNSAEIPGNAGLRDILTLLRWVQTNAAAFGGDPDNVTVAGHSAGASSAHLLSLSDQANGLFNRIILMSGTGIPSFYSVSPIYAQYVANLFLRTLGINSTDPVYIHQQLIEMPLTDIMEANQIVQFNTGVASFVPVVESSFPNVTSVLNADPIQLIKSGRGNEYPLIVGFTSAECYSLQKRIADIDILAQLDTTPTVILSPRYSYELPSNVSLYLAEQVEERYFNGTPTFEKYLDCCSDALFKYPAIALSRMRAESGGSPVYLYYFTFDDGYSVLKNALNLTFNGAGHLEDVTYFFRANYHLGNKSYAPNSIDGYMQDWVTSMFVNFMRFGDPTCSDGESWPPVQSDDLTYQQLNEPSEYNTTPMTDELKNMVSFFDDIEKYATEWDSE